MEVGPELPVSEGPVGVEMGLELSELDEPTEVGGFEVGPLGKVGLVDEPGPTQSKSRTPNPSHPEEDDPVGDAGPVLVDAGDGEEPVSVDADVPVVVWDEEDPEPDDVGGTDTESEGLLDVEPARDVALGLLVGVSEDAVDVWQTVDPNRSTTRSPSSHPVESDPELDGELETEVGLFVVPLDGGGVDELASDVDELESPGSDLVEAGGVPLEAEFGGVDGDSDEEGEDGDDAGGEAIEDVGDGELAELGGVVAALVGVTGLQSAPAPMPISSRPSAHEVVAPACEDGVPAFVADAVGVVGLAAGVDDLTDPAGVLDGVVELATPDAPLFELSEPGISPPSPSSPRMIPRGLSLA